MARRSFPALLIAALGFLTLPGPAAAQAAADPNPGNLTLIGNVDLTNTYMFRGIRQDDTRIITQPSAEMDITLQSASSGLKSTSLNFGTWNSLHAGDTGLRSATSGLGCACNKVWYESDFYTTLAFGFTGGSLGITYTAYTSPNAGFNNVKELMFKFGGDDSSALGKAALHPWAIAAFEFDADNGHQAERGLQQRQGADVQVRRRRQLGARQGGAPSVGDRGVRVRRRQRAPGRRRRERGEVPRAGREPGLQRRERERRGPDQGRPQPGRLLRAE